MKVVQLNDNNSLLNQFLLEIRDQDIQKDSLRFRRNIERIGEIMAYEVSKHLNYSTKRVTTCLGEALVDTFDNKIVLAAILRAALPFHQGMLRYMDNAENAFISAFRKYKDALKFDIHVEYIASPSIDGKTLLLCDPMLATGASMELSYKALLSKGTPGEVHFLTIIATKQAVEFLKNKFMDTNVTLWVAAIDEELNSHSYIVPGLGDAGDLAFGEKL